MGEDDDNGSEDIWDDVSGTILDPTMTKELQKEEIIYLRAMCLYDNIFINDCKRARGKMTITTKWIDINKGDKENSNYKSRTVAQEIPTCKGNDLFAAISFLGASKAILFMSILPSTKTKS